MAKKILLFSPPFSGHLNVLKSLVSTHRHDFTFHLIITGWNNIAPDVSGLDIPIDILAHSDLHETDPALWTLPRVVELMDNVLEITKRIESDLILYDYFSLEGNMAGKILNIPYWSSIPALVGPFMHLDYLEKKLALPINVAAIDELQQRFPEMLHTGQIEMISDGLHLPGENNLLWSYPALTPTDFMVNRQSANYTFVGHLDASRDVHVPKVQRQKPLVYFSFGTVVMDNLWNQQPETQARLKVFIEKFAELSRGKDFDVLFVSRDKPVLDSYPPNWQVVKYADQIAALREASIFITHGGGNSFHEAVLQQVPMIAIPFFGDQPLIANQIEKLGLGKNLVLDNEIDTKKSKDFLSPVLAERLMGAIDTILKEMTVYQDRFKSLSLNATDTGSLLKIG